MTDTKLSALSALTTVGNDDVIYVVDDLAGTPASYRTTVKNLLRLAYGGIYLKASSPNSIALTASTPATVQFGFDLAVNETLVEDGGNHRIQVPDLGIYQADVSLSVSGPGGTELEFEVAYAGAAVYGSSKIRLESSGYTKSASFSTLLDLSSVSVPGYVTVLVTSGSNATISINAGSLIVRRLA